MIVTVVFLKYYFKKTTVALVVPICRGFTKYVDLVQRIYQKAKAPGWAEQELKKIEEDIKSFKTLGKESFSAYQPSEMGSLKWHMLNHLVADLKRKGGISYMESGIYEMAQKGIK